MIKNVNQLDEYAKNRRNEYTFQYYNLNQWPAFADISFKQLSVNVHLLPVRVKTNIKTTTCSSIQYIFFSQWMSFCWNTWKMVTSWLFLKIPEKFRTKGEKRLFLSLKEDNLPNLGSPNSQTFIWSKQNIPRIHLICAYTPVYLAGNQILHSVYTFSKVHGKVEGNWIYSQNCNWFTNL